MKKILLPLLLVTAQYTLAQTPIISLSSPVTVAGTSVYSSVKPRVAVTAGNAPLVVWGKASSASAQGSIYTARWNGTGFNTPLAVNPAGVDVYAGPSEGPNIAANGDTVFVSFFSIPSSSSKIYVVRSVDGGVSFNDTLRADHQTTKTAYTPFVTIDESGNPCLAFEASHPNLSAPEQLFTRSVDGGTSFLNEVNANMNAPGQPCECCPPSVVVKDSLVFLLYRNNENNIRNVYVAVSQDYGASFPTTVQIDNTNWYINGCPSTGAEGVIAGDSLVVTWRSRVGGQTRIYMNKMSIHTLQAGVTRKAEPSYVGTAFQDHPSIAGSNDTVAIVWDDNRTGNSNCYMIASVDGGTTFSMPVMLNDTTTQAGIQRNPHVALKNGVFHIVYQNSSTNEVIYRTAQISGILNIAEDPKNRLLINAVPNPFTHSTLLLFPNAISSPVKVEITDITGRVVRMYAAVNTSSLRVEKGTLRTGIYHATATFENGERAIARIVVTE